MIIRYLAPVLFFGTAGTAIVLTLLRNVVLGLRSRTWSRTPGTIETSELAGGVSYAYRSTEYEAVRYRYTVDGVTYESTRIDYVGRYTGGPLTAGKGFDRYPPGQTVTVWYDPSKPARAVLEPGTSADSIGILLLMLLMGAIGLAFLVSASSH